MLKITLLKFQRIGMYIHNGKDAGAKEYVYALMAVDAGIDMPEVHLFPSQKGNGYFAVKRF